MFENIFVIKEKIDVTVNKNLVIDYLQNFQEDILLRTILILSIESI